MKKEMSALEVAQGTELVKQLCELFGGRFVSEGEGSDSIRDNERSLTGLADGSKLTLREHDKERPASNAGETDGDAALDAGLMNKEETGIQCRDNRQSGLPERAWELLERARDGGLLDERLQPLVSRRRAALLAQIISQEVFGVNRWKAFEELWGIKNLQQYYQTAQYLNTIDSDKVAYLGLMGIKVRY